MSIGLRNFFAEGSYLKRIIPEPLLNKSKHGAGNAEVTKPVLLVQNKIRKGEKQKLLGLYVPKQKIWCVRILMVRS